MKRAATHLFKRQSKNRAFFSKLSNFYFDVRPPGGGGGQSPGQDRGAKTRPQGQLECANPRGSPGGRSGLELTDALEWDVRSPENLKSPNFKLYSLFNFNDPNVGLRRQ